MKIKAVCEATGLTDRTVRYYIEEGLITPSYTENYLGRRSFEYEESHVQQLKDISVLRKFGFTVTEIRQMLQSPESIIPLTMELRQRKEAAVSQEQELLRTLSALDTEQSYTVAQLAACLSAPVVDIAPPVGDGERNINAIICKVMKLGPFFVNVWLPVPVAIFGLVVSFYSWHFPVIEPIAIVFTVLSLLPTMLVLLLPKISISPKLKRLARSVLLALCVISLPFTLFFSINIVSHSETTDFRNYRRFDPDCLANRYLFFQELFPTWPRYFVNEKQPNGDWKEVYLDAHYLYRNLPAWDYTYDIYAEWPLEPEEFREEVARVTKLYEEQEQAIAKESTETYITTVEKGDYTCLIYAPYSPPAFEEVNYSYTYYIFAYDEETLRVRYILCDSLENGYDQPYYLSLPW